MEKIKIAIAGIGNCASSLIQGLEYYSNKENNSNAPEGMMAKSIGGYTAQDIEVVAAFDIDKRKVGKTLDEAIYAKPNCTINIVEPEKNINRKGVRLKASDTDLFCMPFFA